LSNFDKTEEPHNTQRIIADELGIETEGDPAGTGQKKDVGSQERCIDCKKRRFINN